MQDQRVQLIMQQIGKQCISLRGNCIGESGLKLICEGDTLKTTQLYLGCNDISQIGILHFVEAKWDKLIRLELYFNNIGNRGCKYLSKASLNSLQQLSLGQNKLESSGISHLTKAEWKRLSKIWIHVNQISCNTGFLISKACWKLSSIGLKINSVTAAELLKILLSETIIADLCFSSNLIEISEQGALRSAFENKFEQISLII